MLDDLSHEVVAATLSRAAGDPSIPAASRQRARALSERLARGVRIVVLGPKGCGKSALCDALLAQWGPASRAENRIFGGALSAQEPAILSRAGHAIPLDTGVLGQAQVIDLEAPEKGQGFDLHVADCLEMADIVLWCTQAFAEAEARVWQAAPDHLKDHSFLVLTKADLLAEKGILQDRIESFQTIASEEFHSFFPVTINHVREYLRRSQSIPETALAASGVKALRDALTMLVHSGRRADLDSALLLAERMGLALDGPPVSEVASDTSQDTAAQAKGDEVSAACRKTRDELMTRAFDLAELGFDEAEGDMSGVLDLCVAISEDLAQQMGALSGEAPALRDWGTAFEEASDKIMLMTMENDTRSAADAVTILLQLRRDLDQLAI